MTQVKKKRYWAYSVCFKNALGFLKNDVIERQKSLSNYV